MDVMMKSHKVSAAASKARQQPGRATHLRSSARPSTASVHAASVRAAGAGTAAAAAAAPRLCRRHQRSSGSSGGLACRASPEHAEGPSARDIAEVCVFFCVRAVRACLCVLKHAFAPPKPQLTHLRVRNNHNTPAAQDPAAALAKVTEHILAGDLDALLEFVPDEGARLLHLQQRVGLRS